MENPETANPRKSAVWEDKHKRILKSAIALFLAVGYERTTMKQVAGNADCSVGYLYKHFAGKQDLLNEMMSGYLDIYDDIRHLVREDEGLSGLDCLRRELELMCLSIVDHRALIPIITERESSQSDELRRRMEKHHREDIALLDQARNSGEIPNIDPAMIWAVLNGAFEALIRDLAQTRRRETFLTIPDTIDLLIFEPLRLSAASGNGKDILGT